MRFLDSESHLRHGIRMQMQLQITLKIYAMHHAHALNALDNDNSSG